MDYKKFFSIELDNLREQGLYRNFRKIDRPIKNFPNADESFEDQEREVEVWCSNDYLNMSQIEYTFVGTDLPLRVISPLNLA